MKIKDEMYNPERNKAIAKGLESYLDALDLCTLVGRREEDIKEAVKKVKKAIKRLKNNEELEKVFDEERFYEYINNTRDD